ncbi:hypothetical protein HJG60_011108 [Phyllostomus discolor]|uniref:Uncharacterized protein n=1 Tax=Phyllostomus discolor TaxID=89673 RepID=A0A834E522_9CHIR|nr:hypothetical protein HJG60_011108 [Phyllostomus discolor]
MPGVRGFGELRACGKGRVKKSCIAGGQVGRCRDRNVSVLGERHGGREGGREGGCAWGLGAVGVPRAPRRRASWAGRRLVPGLSLEWRLPGLSLEWWLGNGEGPGSGSVVRDSSNELHVVRGGVAGRSGHGGEEPAPGSSQASWSGLPCIVVGGHCSGGWTA